MNIGPRHASGPSGETHPSSSCGIFISQTVAQHICPCIRHQGWPCANLELAQIYAGFYWWTFVHFLWRIEFYPLKNGVGESGYMYMYGWIPSLFTWNYHNVVNRLCAVLCLVTQFCLTFCNPMSCSPPGSSVHGDSPGQNTGLGCHPLGEGIFPTQGSNPGLLHCRQTLPSEPPGKPKNTWVGSLSLLQGSQRMLEWVAYPFSRESLWPRNQTAVSCITAEFFTSWAAREAPLIGYIPVQNKKFKVWGKGDKRKKVFILSQETKFNQNPSSETKRNRT